MNITDEQRTALVAQIRQMANKLEDGAEVRAYGMSTSPTDTTINLHITEQLVDPNAIQEADKAAQ